MRRILFLDIDGVLNRNGPSGEFPLEPSPEEAQALVRLPEGSCKRACRDGDALFALRCLEPPLVTRLNTLVLASGADVVVHSTWRRVFTQEGILWALRYAGYEGTLTGVCPEWLQGQKMSMYPSRADYILEYFWEEGIAPESLRFAILDDEDPREFRASESRYFRSPPKDLRPNFVRVSAERGLADEDVEKALAILTSS